MEIKQILQSLRISLKNDNLELGEVNNMRAVKFWHVYASEELTEINISCLYTMTELPRIINDAHVKESMESFLSLIMQFKRTVNLATKPCVCCCKRTSCFFFFKEIFGTLD